MTIWDDMAATAIETLGDEAIFVDTAGSRLPVRAIPIDEAETWTVRGTPLEVGRSSVIVRISRASVPDPSDGRLEHGGILYAVDDFRPELSGVWVLTLSPISELPSA